MFYGKEKCRILKEIRREIAKNNDIVFLTEECRHKGDCLGTCPKCEAELKYLERELENRRKKGKKVILAGISTVVALNLASCDPLLNPEIDGDLTPNSTTSEEYSDAHLPGMLLQGKPTEVSIEDIIMGDMPWSPPSLDYLASSVQLSQIESLLIGFPIDQIDAQWGDSKLESHPFHEKGEHIYNFPHEKYQYIELFLDKDGYVESIDLFMITFEGDKIAIEFPNSETEQ